MSRKGNGHVKSNHTEAQMIGALKQLEAGREAEDVAREVGVSKHHFEQRELTRDNTWRQLLTATAPVLEPRNHRYLRRSQPGVTNAALRPRQHRNE